MKDKQKTITSSSCPLYMSLLIKKMNISSSHKPQTQLWRHVDLVDVDLTVPGPGERRLAARGQLQHARASESLSHCDVTLVGAPAEQSGRCNSNTALCPQVQQNGRRGLRWPQRHQRWRLATPYGKYVIGGWLHIFLEIHNGKRDRADDGRYVVF